MTTGDNKGKIIRLDLIKKLDWDLRPLEVERDLINLQIRAARQQFKADTGIVLANFDAARRLADIDDQDLQTETMDAIMACFNVLTEGGQVDWIEATADVVSAADLGEAVSEAEVKAGKTTGKGKAAAG